MLIAVIAFSLLLGLLESSEFQAATVSGFGVEENICELNLKCSEAIISCSGNVLYTVTMTPCLSGNCSTIFSVDTNQDVPMNGSVGLEYELTLSTETCDGVIMTNSSMPVNLTGVADTQSSVASLIVSLVAAISSGMAPSYFFMYNISTLMVEAMNVTLPRFCVSIYIMCHSL